MLHITYYSHDHCGIEALSIDTLQVVPSVSQTMITKLISYAIVIL